MASQSSRRLAGSRLRLPERVAGIELLIALLDRAEREQFGVYLLGARPAVVAAAARRVSDRWPRLKLCGVADGYFSADEAPTRARAVARSGAQILIVGMGVPRQEYFIEEQWEALGANIAMGVGGSLDVLAGERRRAPRRPAEAWLGVAVPSSAGAREALEAVPGDEFAVPLPSHGGVAPCPC